MFTKSLDMCKSRKKNGGDLSYTFQEHYRCKSRETNLTIYLT